MNEDEPDDDPGPGIALDKNGDPVRQGTLMVEKQSYERVVDGLRIAAEAVMHLAKLETTREGYEHRRELARNLDTCRRVCIFHAGLEDPVRARRTEEVRGEPLPFKEARDRFVYGLRQAAGGARQLATCHRMDLTWSAVARELETMERNARNPKRMRTSNPLLLPTGYVRH